MKTHSLAAGLVLAGLQTVSAVGHQHGGRYAHFDARPAVKQYATTTTSTTSVVDVTTITTTITVTCTGDDDTSSTTSIAEVATTSTTPASLVNTEPSKVSAAAPSTSSTDSDIESAAPFTAADATGSSSASSSASTISTSIEASTTSSSTSDTSQSISRTSRLTPNGIKAGSAGGNAYPFWSDHIGWWYDWTPNPLKTYPKNTGKPIPVAMLWGDGSVSNGDALRYHEFLTLTSTPEYMLAFEEPDCNPPDSSDISAEKGAQVWNKVIAPWKEKGSLLGSPSMCKQSDEDWLSPFEANVKTSWDFTAIHINTISMDVVKKDLDHYWNNYNNKPIWVTEFACVDTSNGFTPCENQTQINQFITEIVDLLQNDHRVYAYAYSDGAGLGNTWPPVKDGVLTESGRAYLDAIRKYA